MDNKKLVFLKQLSTFVEDRSLWVEPNRKYDFRLSPNPPFTIFELKLEDTFARLNKIKASFVLLRSRLFVYL